MASSSSSALDLVWQDDYNDLLGKVATTDDISSIEWPKLREILKYKINENISSFLAVQDELQNQPPPQPHSPVYHPSGSLKIWPFPARQRPTGGLDEAPKHFLTSKEAEDMKQLIFSQLDEFDQSPPFTIQRVCELSLHPQKNYKTIGKYLRAVDKSILVTSSYGAFPLLAEHEKIGPLQTSLSVVGSPSSSAPPTPMFSPIAFLHDDARRSKSRSPPPSPLTLTPAVDSVTGPVSNSDVPAFGLVDELDDPSPDHMSDHPTALTATTTTTPIVTPEATTAIANTGSRPFLGSLEQRFVPAEKGEDENNHNTGTEGQQQSSTVGGDTDSMDLDENEDKENKE